MRFLMKGGLLLILLCMASLSMAAERFVFISFSMPEQLLVETLKDSARLKIPAILNGLHQNSMQETLKRLMSVMEAIPDAHVQIDPTLFERFNIHQVPALIVAKGPCFDVIYGHLSLQEGLERLHRHGACQS